MFLSKIGCSTSRIQDMPLIRWLEDPIASIVQYKLSCDSSGLGELYLRAAKLILLPSDLARTSSMTSPVTTLGFQQPGGCRNVSGTSPRELDCKQHIYIQKYDNGDNILLNIVRYCYIHQSDITGAVQGRCFPLCGCYQQHTSKSGMTTRKGPSGHLSPGSW